MAGLARGVDVIERVAAEHERVAQDGAREPKRPDKKPPPRPQKPIDPDNPFAALMALKLGR